MLIRPMLQPLSGVSLERLSAANLLRETLPRDASIMAQTTLVPQLPVGERVKLLAGPSFDHDWVVLYPASIRWPMSTEDYVGAVETMLSDGRYGVEVCAHGMVVLRLGAPAGDVSCVRGLLELL